MYLLLLVPDNYPNLIDLPGNRVMQLGRVIKRMQRAIGGRGT